MKGDEVVVSVLITYYNQLEYISDSLSSVLDQDVDFKYEILCGDDGSSDGTYEELLDYQKNNPEIISVYRMARDDLEIYEPIVRVSRNRLNLLKHAKGKYIIFLDGDDYYIDKDKLNKQVTLLEEHTSCVCCGHPVSITDGINIINREVHGNIGDTLTIVSSKKYWSKMWFHSDTMLFRNIIEADDVINPNTFDDNLITCNYLKYGDVLYVPDVMVAYRQSEDSSWNKRNEIEKAIVNLIVYVESKRILNWKFVSFTRYYDTIKCIFNSRKNNTLKEMADLGKINPEFKKCLKRDKFYNRTIDYHSKDIFYKILYEIRYSPIVYGFGIIRKIKDMYEKVYSKVRRLYGSGKTQKA